MITTGIIYDPPRNITLAVTGASGSIYAAEMLRALVADRRVTKINFVVSESALRVLAEEMPLKGRRELVPKLLGEKSMKVEHHHDGDIGANIASGSYPTESMIVIPCSMGTLARIANGFSSTLIERSSDVCMKERRRLVLCIRETPFNQIHLRNMTFAAEAGATIYPIMPALYNHPQNTMEMARQFVGRVLGHIGLDQPGIYAWHADKV